MRTIQPRKKKMSDAALMAWIMGGVVGVALVGGVVYMAASGGLPSVAALVGPPTFDATNEATIKASLKSMGDGMSEAEAKAFAADCMAVAMFSGPNGGKMGEMMRQTMASAFSRGKQPPPDFQTAEIMKPLHGMTASDIHTKAEEIRLRMKEQMKK